MPAVLRPFGKIAVHVMKAKRVGLEVAYLEWLCGVVSLGAVIKAAARVEVGVIGCDRIAGVEHGCHTSAGGVFPFGFA